MNTRKKAEEFVGEGLFGFFWEMVAHSTVLGLRNLIVPKIKTESWSGWIKA